MSAFTVNDIEFEDTDCLICGSNDALPAGAIKWHDTDFRYVLCKTCGLKYMKPRPTQRWYAAFYEEDFWQEKIENKGFTKSKKSGIKPEKGIQKKIAKQRSRAEQIYKMVSSVKQLTAGSLVLEIGASWGVSLNFLQKQTNCQIFAVEPSDIACAYMKDNYGVSIVGRVMEDLSEPQSIDGKVDLTIFSHVLENIVDPLRALEITGRLLAPSGLVYIDTCNFYYNDAMNPYHPYIFAPETLKALLGKAGFEVVSVYSEDHPSVATEPANRYLTVIAQKGQFVSEVKGENAEKLMQDQKLGLELIKKSKKKRKALFK